MEPSCIYKSHTLCLLVKYNRKLIFVVPLAEIKFSGGKMSLNKALTSAIASDRGIRRRAAGARPGGAVRAGECNADCSLIAQHVAR